MEARGPCRSVARSRNRAVLVAFRGTVPLARPGRVGAAGPGGGAAAGGDRAFLQHPGAEPGQGGGRGQGQAQQPQGQAAEDGQRGGRVGGQGRAQLAGGGRSPRRGRRRSGCRWPGRRRPAAGPRWPGSASRARRRATFMNTLVPTAARFSARARSARRPCRASAMPRQAKTRAAASGIAASRAAMSGQVPGGVGHPVLGGEADRGGGRGQDAEAGGGVAQPQAGVIVRRDGLAAVAGRGCGRRAGRLDRASRRRAGGLGWPVMSRPVPVPGMVTSGIGRVMADRLSGRWGLGISCRPLRSGGLLLRSPGG